MRKLDVVVSALLLVLLAPLAAAAAIAILCETPGGVLYRCRRAGKGGRPFTMWKLRTMRREGGLPVTFEGDPRITEVGRLLRRIRLDEYPQLWNVLRGDMALVGPRPEDPAFVDLGDPRWQIILSVPPGITGETQLKWAPRERALLRGQSTMDTYRNLILPQKIANDVLYVQRRTDLEDVLILLRSLTVPFRGGA